MAELNGHDTFANEAPPPPPEAMPDVIVHITSDDEPPPPTVKDGVLTQELPGGALLIDFSGGKSKKKVGKAAHDANLAEYLDLAVLSRIASDVLDGINADLQSRDEWLQKRASGLKHLALKVESPRSPSAEADTAVEGQSMVRWPGLLDAVLRFQANAKGELLPTGGPVKIRNDRFKTQRQLEMERQNPQGADPSMGDTEDRAEALEHDFNHYLTVTDKAYYPDTDRMFFMQGFGGSAFKKVYKDARLKRPVSRAIDAEDIIVSNAEVSLHDCGRVTHRIRMRQSTFKHMVRADIYKDYNKDRGMMGMGGLGHQPSAPEPDPVELAKADIAGFDTNATTRPADYRHTIYECYCELDLDEYEGGASVHDESGLPLPYRITVDKDSTDILEIRRNWREGDERFLARMPIVKFPFVEGMSFYGIGLLDIMGNATAAVSAAWRLALDSAGFSSWPGFLYSDSVGRQDTMSFRVPLGGGVRVNAGGQDIRQAVMPLPYKDVTTGLVQVTQHIEEEARRVGGTPEIMVGEGRADVPVGTTLAMLDQALKVVDSVHKGMHIAQAEELGLLRDLFKEDPEALLCGNPSPARQWEMEELVQALTDCNLTPQADPNTPSHTIRVMKAVALVQLVQMKPDDYDTKKVATRVAAMVGLGSVDDLFAPPAPPNGQQDPKIMVEQLKQRSAAQELQSHLLEMAQDTKNEQEKNQIEQAKMKLDYLMKLMDIKDREAERQSRERVEYEKQRTERIQFAESAAIHPLSVPVAAPFLPGFSRGGRVI